MVEKIMYLCTLFILLDMQVMVLAFGNDSDTIKLPISAGIQLHDSVVIYSKGADDFENSEDDDQLIDDIIAVDIPSSAESDSQLGRSKRSLKDTSLQVKLWPDGIVYWEYGSSRYSSRAKRLIVEAMNMWEEHTCIRFRKGGSTKDGVTLSIITEKKYCSSFLGYMPGMYQGKQLLQLSEDSCLSKVGLAVHELGHTLGLIHEHQKHERDHYLNLHAANINPGQIGQFVKKSKYEDPIPEGIPVDISSIMQYNPKKYARSSGRTNPTMVAVNSMKQDLMGQRDTLGYYDIKAVNTLYKCGAGCYNRCENEGYSRKVQGRCICVCPEGLTGSRCERVESTSCGGIINLRAGGTREITTPNYPRSRNHHEKCVWLINSPRGYLVQVMFDSMNLAETSGRSNEAIECRHHVEVRNNILGQRGNVFCGSAENLGPFDTQLDLSKNQMMIILDSTDRSVNSNKGFTATVKSFTHACIRNPCQNKGTCVPVGSSRYTCTCPVGFIGQNCERVNDAAINCDFADNYCHFVNSESNDFDWVQLSDSQKYLEKLTHSSNGNEFYLAAPTPFTLKRRGFGDLVSPVFTTSSVKTRCIKFKYHQAGFYVYSKLEVYTRSVRDGSLKSVYKARNTAGWKSVTKEIRPNDDFQVIFRLQMNGQQPMSSMRGLDDIEILPQSCYNSPCRRNSCSANSVCVEESSSKYHCLCPEGMVGDRCDAYDTDGYTCTFDDANLCGWQRGTSDNYDWDRSIGVADVGKRRTGPSTGAKSTGFYLLADSSHSKALEGAVARIISPNLKYKGRICVHFSYHMYTQRQNKLGSLKLKLRKSGQLSSHAYFSKSSSQSSNWLSKSVNVDITDGNTQIVFEATAGDKHLSDIAIDEVKVTHGRCAQSSAKTTQRSRRQMTVRQLYTTTPRPHPTPSRYRSSTRRAQSHSSRSRSRSAAPKYRRAQSRRNSPTLTTPRPTIQHRSIHRLQSNFNPSNISFTKGRLSSTNIDILCNFDGNSQCAFTQNEKTDQIDWKLSSADRSYSGGPRTAHSGHSYYYISNSRSFLRDESAMLESPEIPANSGKMCLSYFQLTNDRSTNWFTIYQITTNNGRRYNLDVSRRSQNGRWKKGMTTIDSNTKPYKIVIRGTVEAFDDKYSIIALDDLVLKSGTHC